MSWLFLTIVYLALHFILYVLLLRQMRLFAKEIAVFLYQFGSFLALPVTLFVFTSRPVGVLPSLLAAMSIHGIYSLSFLELWSLSEGSYSLRILERIERLGTLPVDADVSDLQRIGTSKKSSRLDSLQKLGLVGNVEGRYALTCLGRFSVALLRFQVWMVNIKSRIG